MEIWKDVPGYVGLYKVSNYGRVKSIKKQLVLKICGSGNRYKTVALCNGMRKTFRLHRLVAAAFIPNPEKAYKKMVAYFTPDYRKQWIAENPAEQWIARNVEYAKKEKERLNAIAYLQ